LMVRTINGHWMSWVVLGLKRMSRGGGVSRRLLHPSALVFYLSSPEEFNHPQSSICFELWFLRDFNISCKGMQSSYSRRGACFGREAGLHCTNLYQSREGVESNSTNGSRGCNWRQAQGYRQDLPRVRRVYGLCICLLLNMVDSSRLKDPPKWIDTARWCYVQGFHRVLYRITIWQNRQATYCK